MSSRKNVRVISVSRACRLAFLLVGVAMACGGQSIQQVETGDGQVRLQKTGEIVFNDTSHFVLGDVQRVAMDSDGGLWVLDWGSESLVHYNADGKNPRLVAARGQGPGELLQPEDLSIGHDGHLFVANIFGRVTEFDASGQYVNSFVPIGANIPISWLHVDREDRIYLGGRRRLPGGLVNLFSRDGKPSGRTFLENEERVYKDGLHPFSGTRCCDLGSELMCVQPATYMVTIVTKEGEPVRRFGVPTEHYKRADDLLRDDRINERRMRRFRRNFTYVTDVFGPGDLAIVQSRNDIGKDEPDHVYFLDFYDRTEERLIAGSVEIPGPVEIVRNNLLYILTTRPLDSGSFQHALEIYRYHIG